MEDISLSVFDHGVAAIALLRTVPASPDPDLAAIRAWHIAPLAHRLRLTLKA